MITEMIIWDMCLREGDVCNGTISESVDKQLFVPLYVFANTKIVYVDRSNKRDTENRSLHVM